MIYLVRHGQTVFNAEGRFQGHRDSTLTDLGCVQATAVGRRLRAELGDPARVVFESSPQGRAVQTAELLRAEIAGLPAARLDPRLCEIGLGSWEGLTQADLEARWPGAWRGSVRQSWVAGCPDGETWAAARSRLRAWLDGAMAAASAEAPRLAVSHGVAIAILRALWLGLSQTEAMALPVAQGVIWRLDPGAVTAMGAWP